MHLFFYFFVAVGLTLASTGNFISYSYWIDELYSVTAANRSISVMIQKYMLTDVHPPFYQIILNIWINIFGDHEQFTRLLSFIFGISSLYIIYRWSIKNFNSTITGLICLFFATNWMFAYYSQETRSYAMLMFLATILTVLFLTTLDNTNRKNIIKCSITILTISLTHYFGLIYGGLILIYLLWLNRKKYINFFILLTTGLLSILYPILHIIYGTVSSKTNNNFWIESDGIQTTLTKFTGALFPEIRPFIKKALPFLYSEWTIAIIILVTLSIITITIYFNIYKSEIIHKKKYMVLPFYLITFIATIAIIDYHTPISTNRNFIVILPLFSILFGLTIYCLFHNHISYIIIIAIFFGLSQSFMSGYKVHCKNQSIENLKTASKFIVKKYNKDHKYNIYYTGANTLKSKNVNSYYLKRYGLPVSENIKSISRPVSIHKLKKLNKPFFVLTSHQKKDTVKNILNEVKKSSLDIKYYIPEQCSLDTIVFYSKNCNL